MRLLTVLSRQSAAGLRLLLLFTVLLGVVYPLLTWGVAHLPGLADRAEGSVVTSRGVAVGSSLIGVDPVPADAAADPYFHTRPSASAEGPLGPGDPSTSGGSNKGAFDTDLLDTISRRRESIAAREGVTVDRVPADAVTASASGVDPHISPAYAELQAPRVARMAGLDEARVRDLVAAHTDGRILGFLGDPGVNITELNVAVAEVRAVDRARG